MFFRQKLLKHQYTDNVTDIVFFIACKIYFLLAFLSVGFEGNKKYAKKAITSGME